MTLLVINVSFIVGFSYGLACPFKIDKNMDRYLDSGDESDPVSTIKSIYNH